jgi:hypothetical protein
VEVIEELMRAVKKLYIYPLENEGRLDALYRHNASAFLPVIRSDGRSIYKEGG